MVGSVIYFKVITLAIPRMYFKMIALDSCSSAYVLHQPLPEDALQWVNNLISHYLLMMIKAVHDLTYTILPRKSKEIAYLGSYGKNNMTSIRAVYE